MSLTIDDYWRGRLASCERVSGTTVRGWAFDVSAIEGFTEAPLDRVQVDGEPDHIMDGQVILVSAPGAVGKSTLARQIAHMTRAVYVDLAECDPVGAMYVTGGLAAAGLLQTWPNGHTTLLLDGLDEARLKVTQEAFDAFLRDVSTLASQRSVPVVVFGRTGSIQDSQRVLRDGPATYAVAEIGFYRPAQAAKFVERLLRLKGRDTSHHTVEDAAILAILGGLRGVTGPDGDRFAGYAPVLTTVADYVFREENASLLLAKANAGVQLITLPRIANAILERDHGKLGRIVLEDEALRNILYTPVEQLDRCVAVVFGGADPELPEMSARDAQTYANALAGWMNDHPFLNNGMPSSIVFGAMIAVHALRKPEARDAAVQQGMSAGAAANPFLFDFYFDENRLPGTPLPPEHVGILYASLRAGLAIGDVSSLLVEGAKDAGEADSADEENALRATVEIKIKKARHDVTDVKTYQSDQLGTLRLPGHLCDVDVTLPYGNVEVGAGSVVVLAAPISIVCRRLTIISNSVCVEGTEVGSEALVFLEAEDFVGNGIANIPTLRDNGILKVSWPGSKSHPWTAFTTTPREIEDPRLKEAMRRFRRFVMAFRSHSKSALARYTAKLDHERMTKGSGGKVLALLLQDGIVGMEGAMYYLDSSLLGSKAHATYTQCVTKNYSEKTLSYITQGVLRAAV